MKISFAHKVCCDIARLLEESNNRNIVARMLVIVFFNPGFQLAFSIRIQELLGRIPFIGKILRRMLWYWTTIYFGSDIDPTAEFGPGIYFPHPHGIVIGSNCRLGRDCAVLQGVTLGRNRSSADFLDIGDGVAINAGAKVIGSLTIGDNAIIGANAVVIRDVPAGHTAVGVPARLLPPRDSVVPS